jgi:hypothetical protein
MGDEDTMEHMAGDQGRTIGHRGCRREDEFLVLIPSVSYHLRKFEDINVFCLATFCLDKLEGKVSYRCRRLPSLHLDIPFQVQHIRVNTIKGHILEVCQFYFTRHGSSNIK